MALWWSAQEFPEFYRVFRDLPASVPMYEKLIHIFNNKPLNAWHKNTLPPLVRRILALTNHSSNLIERTFGVDLISYSPKADDLEVNWEIPEPERMFYDHLICGFVSNDSISITSWQASIATYCWAEKHCIPPQTPEQLYFLYHDFLLDQVDVALISEADRKSGHALLEWFGTDPVNELTQCMFFAPARPLIKLQPIFKIIRAEFEKDVLPFHRVQSATQLKSDFSSLLWMTIKSKKPYSVYTIQCNPLDCWAALTQLNVPDDAMNMVWLRDRVFLLITHQELQRIVMVKVPLLLLKAINLGKKRTRKRRQRAVSPFLAAAYLDSLLTPEDASNSLMSLLFSRRSIQAVDCALAPILLHAISSYGTEISARIQQAYREELVIGKEAHFETSRVGFISALSTFMISNAHRAISYDGCLLLAETDIKRKLIKQIDITKINKASLVTLTASEQYRLYTEAAQKPSVFETLHAMTNHYVYPISKMLFSDASVDDCASKKGDQVKDPFLIAMFESERLSTYEISNRNNLTLRSFHLDRHNLWNREIVPRIPARQALLISHTNIENATAFQSASPYAASCLLIHPIKMIRLPNNFMDNNDLRTFPCNAAMEGRQLL